MSETEKVLPCPFCGSGNINTEGPCETQFMCNTCGVQSYEQSSRANAFRAWNLRHRSTKPAPENSDPAAVLMAHINALFPLAVAAGLHVGIKITEAPTKSEA